MGAGNFSLNLSLNSLPPSSKPKTISPTPREHTLRFLTFCNTATVLCNTVNTGCYIKQEPLNRQRQSSALIHTSHPISGHFQLKVLRLKSLSLQLSPIRSHFYPVIQLGSCNPYLTILDYSVLCYANISMQNGKIQKSNPEAES